MKMKIKIKKFIIKGFNDDKTDTEFSYINKINCYENDIIIISDINNYKSYRVTSYNNEYIIDINKGYIIDNFNL